MRSWLKLLAAAPGCSSWLQLLLRSRPPHRSVGASLFFGGSLKYWTAAPFSEVSAMIDDGGAMIRRRFPITGRQHHQRPAVACHDTDPWSRSDGSAMIRKARGLDGERGSDEVCAPRGVCASTEAASSRQS